MHNKHIILLKYLLSQNSIKNSSDIASSVGFSATSIKNYVKEINDEQKAKVILSSKQGYYVNKEAALLLLSKNNDVIPQNYKERSYYLIKLLLLKHIDKIDIYTLCDMLFVSYSTLKTDIVNMNKTYSNFGIKFVCENDCLMIAGPEKCKRKLVSHVIFDEVSGNFFDINYLKQNFKNLDISKIREIVKATFKKHNYYLNDINLFNIVFHLAIIINRIIECNYINTKSHLLIENVPERLLIEDLTARLEQAFNISIDFNEQHDIYILFKNNTNSFISNNLEDIKNMIGNSVIDLTKELVKKVNEHYYIDLSDDSFVVPFSLHLKNLFIRMQNHASIKNPMLDIIKINSPTIYEIAIYISFQLQKRFQISIDEDEVAYISLHIGAELERQRVNKSKIPCILFCPEYMQMNQTLYNKLLLEFGSYINIIDTMSNIDLLDHYNFDMLITTLNVEKKPDYEMVYISPFLSKLDINAVFNCIEAIKNKKMHLVLKNNFHRFFSKDTFFSNPLINKKEEAIALMSNRLADLGYVDNDFYSKVLERENAASTAFENFAIPHSVEMNAIKTSISVLISKEGILWDAKTINFVLMVAINSTDKKVFYELYQALVVLFSDSERMKLIKEVSKFEDFMSLIYSSVS